MIYGYPKAMSTAIPYRQASCFTEAPQSLPGPRVWTTLPYFIILLLLMAEFFGDRSEMWRVVISYLGFKH